MSRRSILKLILTAVICALVSFDASAQRGKYNDSHNFNLALEALDNEDYSKAMQYLEKEIAIHDDNAEAHYLISLLHYNNGDYGDALSSTADALKNASRKDKAFQAQIYAHRGDIYSTLDNTEMAEKDFSQAIRLQPDDTDYYKKRAQFYYEQRMYDLSDNDYSQMRRIDPSSYMGYMGYGRNCLARKEFEKAIEQFDYAGKMYKDYASVYSFRAEAYAGLGKWKEFADDVVTALGINGDDKAFFLIQEHSSDAFTLLTTKLKAKAANEPNQSYWPYCIGIVYESAEKYDSAIESYKKSMKMDPDDFTAERITACYELLHDWSNALSYINKAIQIDSTNAGYFMTRASIENELGKEAEAIADVDYYLSINPEDDFGYYRLAWIKSGMDDSAGAIEDYTTAITLDPERSYYYANRGSLLHRLGKTDEANADFEKVLQIDTLINENSCRHYALFYLGMEAEAFEWMQSMIEKYGRDNYYDAACLYSLAGNTDKAMEYLRLAFENGYRRFVHIGKDHDLDNIRNLDSFKSLVDEYKAIQDAGSEADEAEYIEKVIEVPFTRSGGVTKVKCNINGLPLSFIFDTGASTVSISSLEATFMYKNDYLSDKDIIGRSTFVDANGDISVGTVINLSKVSFGGLELTNVKASVVSNDNAPLLLGQSVLNRLGKIEIDYENSILKITTKERK